MIQSELENVSKNSAAVAAHSKSVVMFDNMFVMRPDALGCRIDT